MIPITSVDLSAPVILVSCILYVVEKRKRCFLMSAANMPGKTHWIGVCLCLVSGCTHLQLGKLRLINTIGLNCSSFPLILPLSFSVVFLLPLKTWYPSYRQSTYHQRVFFFKCHQSDSCLYSLLFRVSIMWI